MALTEPQAKVLGALDEDHAQALTVRELRARTGLSAQCARDAARQLAYDGLATSTDSIPTYVSITGTGRAEISRSVYREYRTTKAREIRPVWIPPGPVEIGSPEQHLESLADTQHYSRTWFNDEAPQHKVTVDGFWIDRHPVTNAQFAEFTDATGWITGAERRGDGLVYGPDMWQPMPGISWRRPRPDIGAAADRPEHPVVHVDHADATAYAGWAGKRLPTEPEWEYAAHGPTWQAWPWSSAWSRLAANTAEFWAGSPMRELADWKRWYAGHWREHGPAPATTAVGMFPASASPFGCLDMAGNVTEWTASTYRFYGPGNYDDGFGAAARLGYLVARGGSWKMMRLQTRTSERICGVPEYEAYDLGFRCATNLPAPHPLPTTENQPTTTRSS